MEALSNLESFARSAELGSFSAAARQLGLTPAAVSRNVAHLEGNLGVRLFHRSTRRLALTESGEKFLGAVSGGLASIQAAVEDVATHKGAPSGTLKVSMVPQFGIDFVVPLLPAFLTRYPAVIPDWRFENRQVDLIGEGYDAAIGAGFELTPGVVARELARAHFVAVASPAFLADRPVPRHPQDLAKLPGIAMRSALTGRIRTWLMRNKAGEECAVDLQTVATMNDAEALTQAAVAGAGVVIAPMPHVHVHLANGALKRLVPGWYVDQGAIWIYFASKHLLPAKTRVFVDFIVDHFKQQKLAKRFAA